MILPHASRPPGKHPRGDHRTLLETLRARRKVFGRLLDAGLAPLVVGDDLPPLWARRTAESLYLFFAHPKARELRYPMGYGQSFCRERVVRRIAVDFDGALQSLDLVFDPYQSFLVCLSRAEGVRFIDIGYRPPEPACSV